MKKKFYLLLFFLLFFFSLIFGKIFHDQKYLDSIVIGAKNCTENRLIAEIFATLIEKKLDVKVRRKFYFEGTFFCFEAMLVRDIDMYIEYTGTALTSILQVDPSTIKDVFPYVKRSFHERYGLKWLKPIGFHNSYVFLMKKELAKQLGIMTLLDLEKKVASEKLQIALDPEFIVRKEWQSVKNYYSDFQQLRPKIMDHALLYLALQNNVIDVCDGYATDSEIQEKDLFVIEDDQHILPSYDAALLVNEEFLKKHPEIQKVCNLLRDKISDEKIKELNYLVEKQRLSEKNVALQFLKQEGLL